MSAAYLVLLTVKLIPVLDSDWSIAVFYSRYNTAMTICSQFILFIEAYCIM